MWTSLARSNGDVTLLNQLPSCPPTAFIARWDVNFQRENLVSSMTSDSRYHQSYMEFFHPDIATCYRQSIPLVRGPGQQCCYGRNGVLVRKPRGGSADRISPLRNYNMHTFNDLLPYVLCCKVASSCSSTYYQVRPEGSDFGYRLPIPACVYGDPHIVTLDGHKYTFNGKGEFVLIQTTTNLFALQGRKEQVVDADGDASPGTVFTAIVARQISSNISVQFEVGTNSRPLVILVNGEEAEFDNVAVLEFDDVVLLEKENDTVQALFSSGANVEISVLNGIINVMLIALPESMKKTTSGLMGSYNDIISDDLLPKSGGAALPLNSDLQTIHNVFGMTWILSNSNESYFTYQPGQDFMTFHFPNFVPMFTPSFTDDSLKEEAEAVCGNDTFCLFDIAATKRVEIGAATMVGQEMLNTIVEMSKPIICDPICENGVCLENNTCSCDDGYSGDRCNKPLLEVCDANPCLNNGSCSKLASTFQCNCTSQYTGSICQTKVPPFRTYFLNGSPRVRGSTVFIEFSSSKPANYKCALNGSNIPCSQNSIVLNGVSEGVHNLRIESKTNEKERYVLRRKVYIGTCVTQLINDGLTVSGNGIVVEFTGSSDVESFSCRLDGVLTTTLCRSPFRLNNLSPGDHKLAIKPNTCAGKAIAMKFSV